MWADTLLSLERAHLVRLALWGAGSVLVGTMVLLIAQVAQRRREPHPQPLLTHFAIQTAAWGAVDLAICAWAWRGLAMRDVNGATSLVNFLWLNVGLDIGYVGVGVTLALVSWRLGQRLAGVGAGMGVIVQGLALAVLDAVLIAEIAAARMA